MITLKTLHTATAQQVFDQCVTHLLTQGKRSVNKKGLCMYRGPGGLKCAAGIFIGDDEYRKEMECKRWDVISPVSKHSGFISRLQGIHDNINVSEWPDYLGDIAWEYQLNSHVLDKLTEGHENNNN